MGDMKMDKVLDMRQNNLFLRNSIFNRFTSARLENVKLFKRYHCNDANECLYTNIHNPYDLVLKSICKPTDEIIIMAPYPSMHYNAAIRYGNVIVTNEIDEMVATKKTRAIILSNPNPLTGRVYSRDEMKKIIDFASKNYIYLIVTEDESGSVKHFQSFYRFDNRYRYLFVINTVYYKKNSYLSMIIGPKDIIRSLVGSRNIKGKINAIVKYHQSKGNQKRLQKIHEMNYQIIKDYCEKRKIIFMRDSKASYMIMKISYHLLNSRGILTIDGRSIGMSDSYCAIAMNVETKSIIKFVRRLGE